METSLYYVSTAVPSGDKEWELWFLLEKKKLFFEVFLRGELRQPHPMELIYKIPYSLFIDRQ